MKEPKTTQTNEEIVHVSSWIGRIKFVKINTTRRNLQIQRNPYQITNSIFHRLEQKLFGKNFRICVEILQSDSQSNLEKEKWRWVNQAS